MAIPPQDSQVWLSLVIPAFNEEKRILKTLAAVSDFLLRQPWRSEIVVVDDGSTDRTSEVVRGIAAGSPVEIRVAHYPRNCGKGHALKVGFELARGARIGFSDADLSTPIEELPRLLAEIDRGFDVVIGSRKMEGAEIAIHQPWYREWMGKVYTQLVAILLARVSDVTCGFKVYRGEVGRDLFSRVRIADWSFDAELLLLAKRRGYSLLEVPVLWKDERGSKVRLGRDVFASVRSLLRIRWNAMRGVYDRPVAAGSTLTVWAALPKALGASEAE